jgi:serine/threonine-protein kinase RsbT
MRRFWTESDVKLTAVATTLSLEVRVSEALSIPIVGAPDVVTARVEGRNLARKMGFGVVDQARISTAISELASNVVLHVGAGTITLRPIQDPRRRGLEIVCCDHGQGIADVNLVMREDHSRHRGLGMGLSGTRRLVDEFEICSEPGQGTVVTARKWLR